MYAVTSIKKPTLYFLRIDNYPYQEDEKKTIIEKSNALNTNSLIKFISL